MYRYPCIPLHRKTGLCQKNIRWSFFFVFFVYWFFVHPARCTTTRTSASVLLRTDPGSPKKTAVSFKKTVLVQSYFMLLVWWEFPMYGEAPVQNMVLIVADLSRTSTRSRYALVYRELLNRFTAKAPVSFFSDRAI